MLSITYQAWPVAGAAVLSCLLLSGLMCRQISVEGLHLDGVRSAECHQIGRTSNLVGVLLLQMELLMVVQRMVRVVDAATDGRSVVEGIHAG